MKRPALIALGLTATVLLTSGCGGRQAEQAAGENLNDPTNSSTSQVFLPDGNLISKSPSNKVVLVEFTDYQSPDAKVRNKDLSALASKYAGRITIEVRSAPREELYNNSRIAAQGAEAVRKQDQSRYQAFADLMFQNQDTWSKKSRSDVIETMVGYVNTLHLDEHQFRSDVDSKTIKGIVQKDMDDAKSLQIPDVPVIFLNGGRIAGTVTTSRIQSEVDSLLAK